MIANVQKLYKLEETEISIRLIDACKVLNEEINSIYERFQERKINIEIDASDKKFLVRANELLLDVFENILLNAIKYNDKPIIKIMVKVSREQKEGINFLKIEFIDKGIGIADSRKELIFQKGHEEHKGVKGMGLGLSLSKKIIEKYNGEIWIEDRIKGDYSKGSNFIILIPESD